MRQRFNLYISESHYMILSICIPTLLGREQEFNRLHAIIKKQIDNNPLIELIILKDNKEMPIGIKRQRLLDLCKGEYCVQLDDDDIIPDYYIEEVLKALETKPTHIGQLEAVHIDGRNEIACHSDRFREWANNKDGYDYVRTIFNKNVIKTSICRLVGYSNVRYAEDIDFSIRLKASGLLLNEVFIDKAMYEYTYNTPTYEEHLKRYGLDKG